MRILLLGLLAAALPALAEANDRLAGCYVGAVPCGTPAEMARTVARCLADPARCGSLERPLPHQVTAAGAVPAPRQPKVVPAPSPAVTALARSLPLDPAWREVADGLPVDPADVMRRLGLRPSHAAPTDLRGTVPSAEALLTALLPGTTP